VDKPVASPLKIRTIVMNKMLVIISVILLASCTHPRPVGGGSTVQCDCFYHDTLTAWYGIAKGFVEADTAMYRDSCNAIKAIHHADSVIVEVITL
jgi:hypothetical protein